MLILFFILDSLLFWLLTKYQLRYMANSKKCETISRVNFYVSLAGVIIMNGIIYYLTLMICSLSCTLIAIIISLLLFIITYCQTSGRKIFLVGKESDTSKYADLPKLCRFSGVLIPLGLSPVILLGSIFFCRWLFPDVTTIRYDEGRYEATSAHVFPFCNGFTPTGSFVENDSGDTLYRVVVSYAFLGEEIYNHYNITDTFPPGAVSRIPCPPNFTTRSIFPIMPPSQGKTGRIRARRSYIVNGNELTAFEKGDFSYLGIKANIRVDSFNITRNDIVWEDPERIVALEKIIDKLTREHRSLKNKEIIKSAKREHK